MLSEYWSFVVSGMIHNAAPFAAAPVATLSEDLSHACACLTHKFQGWGGQVHSTCMELMRVIAC